MASCADSAGYFGDVPIYHPGSHERIASGHAIWRSGAAACLALLLCLSFFAPLHAATIHLSENNGRYPLVGHASVLYDAQQTLTIEDVVSRRESLAFQPMTNAISGGYAPGQWWVAIDLQRDASAHHEWWIEIEPAFLDYLDFFIPGAEGSDGKITRIAGGDMLPMSTRELKYRNQMFRVSFPDHRIHTVYVRLRTKSSLDLRGSVWAPHTFANAAIFEMTAFGAYLTAWACITAAAFFAWWRQRRGPWGWLTVYLGADGVLFSGANGLLFQSVIPNFPWLNNRIYWLALPILTVAGIRFFGALFEITRDRRPWTWALLRAQEIVAVIAGIVGFFKWFGFGANLLERNLLLFVVTCLILSAQRVKHDVPGARWQFSAFLVIALAAIATLARNQGLIPMVPLLDHIWQINLLLHAAMLGVSFVQQSRAERRRRKNAVRSRRRAKLEMRQAAARQHFVSCISHEYRAPLAIIAMTTHNLMDKAASAGQMGSYRKIQRAQVELTRLTDNFLSDGAIRRGFVPRPVPVDLVAFMEQVLDHMRPILESHPVTVLRSRVPERVSVDADLLRIALHNTLTNAAKYSSAESPVVIRIKYVESASCSLHITVRDRGNGIPENELSRIFDRYYRTSGARGSGTGIGLHLVKQICEAHGGSVRARSTPKVGTTITMTFSTACIPQAGTMPPAPPQPAQAQLPFAVPVIAP